MELIETTCKTILGLTGDATDTQEDVPKLVKQTLIHLGLDPAAVAAADGIAREVYSLIRNGPTLAQAQTSQPRRLTNLGASDPFRLLRACARRCTQRIEQRPSCGAVSAGGGSRSRGT